MLVAHDTPAKIKIFKDQRNIGYTMLSDPRAEIIPAFGIANPQFPKGSSWYGVAIPMIFVAAPDGTITHRFSYASHRDRHDIDAILAALK